MPEVERGTRERSGCALTLGVLLILFGSVLLAVNLDLFDWSMLTVLRRAVVLFADYWPLILVGWGAFKVFRYFTAPSRTRVGFFEVVFLLFIVGCGLTLRTARRVMSEIGTESSFDHLFDFVEMEIIGAPAHRFTEESNWELAPEATSLVIENGEGAVEIAGHDLDRIEAVLTKRIHHLSESEAARLAEDVSVDFSTGGDGEVRLSVRTPGRDARIATDLKLLVPRRLSVSVSNRRGPLSARSLKGLVDVATSHGEVEARDLDGGLRARTSHARLRAENVGGAVELRNDRGAIDVRRVRGGQGTLTASTSHGRLSVEDVEGSVYLENRYSSVRADRVSGSIDVSGEHTEVALEDVEGPVTVRTSYEPVFVRRVRGGAKVDSSHAPIQVVDVTGAVDVSGPSASVTLSRLGGSARVSSRPSDVAADDVAGPLSIEDVGEQARVTSFRSSLEIRSTHAEIVVATTELEGPVTLETTYGDLELALPANASARILARTRDGELRNELPKIDFRETTEGGERRWEGTLLDGTHAIDVSTRHGDLRLRERR
jgi:DUF4097 and DUF4098 domain-containing protein YvlB